VLVSGFLFPLETASPVIRWASYASPLTFSGKMLESWLFFGTGALVFLRDILCLAVQALAVAVLLALTIGLVSRRV
jgi:ABC-type multidrug transport system permease subunit